MPAKLSPEQMREPLRSIIVTAPDGARNAVFCALQRFASTNRFKLRLSRDPAKPDDAFVQLYRADIKFIGRMAAIETHLKLVVYRTLHRAPVEAVNQGVNGLRNAIGVVPGADFKETIFVRGDDMSLEPQEGYPAARTALVRLPTAVREVFKNRLLTFADDNGLAIGFSQVTPDPTKVTFDMYDEAVTISGFTPFDETGLYVDISRCGDRSAPEDYIDHLWADLKRAVLRVEGVTYEPRT